MSQGTFGADTDAIARAGASFSQLADAAERMAAVLATQITSVGECWGDDQIGKQFAKDYLPARAQVLEALPGIAKVLRKTGDGVTLMSKGLANGEEQAKLVSDLLSRVSGDAPASGQPGTGGQHGSGGGGRR
ncbi:hypothetical protein [Crossiella sp. NPDC003009]